MLSYVKTPATATDWDAVAQRIEEVRDIARQFAKQARGHFGTRLRGIRLYGSGARGDWREDSDVDVLVLLDRVRATDREWIAERATRLGVLKAGVVLSTVTLPEAEFRKLQDRQRLFAREVERDGIEL